jgi:hypothetical protein
LTLRELFLFGERDLVKLCEVCGRELLAPGFVFVAVRCEWWPLIWFGNCSGRAFGRDRWLAVAEWWR